MPGDQHSLRSKSAITSLHGEAAATPPESCQAKPDTNGPKRSYGGNNSIWTTPQQHLSSPHSRTTPATPTTPTVTMASVPASRTVVLGLLEEA